jgi:hypothetical protein
MGLHKQVHVFGVTGGSITRGRTNDETVMITCCNDGTRPVIFKWERIAIEEKIGAYGCTSYNEAVE